MHRLLPLLLLAACAQPAPAAVEAVGLTESDLVARLGVPAGSYEAEGRRFLTFEGQGSAGPSVTPSLGFGIGRFGGGGGSGTALGTGLGLSFGGGGAGLPCTTTYELRGGIVTGSTRQGPGCG